MLDSHQIENEHPGLTAWRNGRETGASSKAIADYLTGERDDRFWDYPLDAADFNRCENLLATVGSLRLAFVTEMPDANQYWAALVPEWEAIKAAEDKTAAIRAIIRPIESADPSHARISDGMSMRIGGASPEPKMKETDADRDVADKAYRASASQIRSFVERFERLEAEKKDIADQQKEVMAEAKATGYDTKVLRKLIALRKRDPSDVAEEDAVLEMYKEALGM